MWIARKRFERLTRRGNTPGRPGLYLKLPSGDWVDHPGGPLPGSGQERYLRVPVPLVMTLGPVAGGFYVLLGAFLGLGLVAWFLVLSTARAGRAVLALTATPAWLPGRAYFVRLRARRERRGRSRTAATGSQTEENGREIEEEKPKED